METMERDLREEECKQIHQQAGMTYHMLPQLYADAVADALERAGVSVEDCWGNPDEPRTLTIELEFPPDPYELMQVSWAEDRGWYYVPFADERESLGDYLVELDCDYLAVPADVAAALLKSGGIKPDKAPGDPCAWTPPADYDVYPDLPEDDRDVSPALERALAAYATHPARRTS